MGETMEQGFRPSLAFLYITNENHKKIQTPVKQRENGKAASWEFIYSCLALVLR